VTESVEQEFIARIKVLHDTVWDRHASRPAVDGWLENFARLPAPEATRERLYALCLLSQFMGSTSKAWRRQGNRI
jgi:hypothetical protein